MRYEEIQSGAMTYSSSSSVPRSECEVSKSKKPTGVLVGWTSQGPSRSVNSERIRAGNSESACWPSHDTLETGGKRTAHILNHCVQKRTAMLETQDLHIAEKQQPQQQQAQAIV